MVEASHEDAAADADSVGAVDDHGVALDAALRIGRADGCLLYTSDAADE